MYLGLFQAFKGRQRTEAKCPICTSPRVRLSRRRYDGPGARIFKVRPVKCLACGAYFPVTMHRLAWSHLDPIELGIPFRPTEFDVQAGHDSGEIVPRQGGFLSLRSLKCPDCGSRQTHPASSDVERSLFRLDAKELHRCSECNGSFDRTNPVRLAILLVLLGSVLGGAAYAINSMGIWGSKAGTSSPRIRPRDVPKVPPPVFR